MSAWTRDQIMREVRELKRAADRYEKALKETRNEPDVPGSTPDKGVRIETLTEWLMESRNVAHLLENGADPEELGYTR